MNDVNWSCSKTYSDQDYALTFCPRDPKNCGAIKEFVFEERNATQALEVLNMTEGETCNFKIKSKCGSPAFSVERLT